MANRHSDFNGNGCCDGFSPFFPCFRHNIQLASKIIAPILKPVKQSFFFLVHKLVIDCRGGIFARAHGKDNGSCTRYGVAARINLIL